MALVGLRVVAAVQLQLSPSSHEEVEGVYWRVMTTPPYDDTW